MTGHIEPRFRNLRKGRASVKYARYFITICVRDRKRTLCTPEIFGEITSAWKELHDASDALTLGGIVMPDHIHWLCQLGDRLSLSRVVGKFKSRTRETLLNRNLSWETNYWDHRISPDETSDDYIAYMFANPYRAGLIPPGAPWPHARWPFDFSFESAASYEKPKGWSSP